MVSYVYKKYLQWLNQVQLFRNELADMEAEVRKRRCKRTAKEGATLTLILAAVAEMNRECSVTDKIILKSLNKDRIIWTGKYNDYRPFDNDLSEDCLPGRIKVHFNAIANLQQTVTSFLLTENAIENNEHTTKGRKKDRRSAVGVQQPVSLSEVGIL